MSEIILRNVCKEFEKGSFAVKDFNLDIRDREFIIFVGPSGCGKSTTLRMIAGLEDISDGELWIDGELCNYYEPKDRGLSMVFQNYALYPNMTVYGNLAYALKIRKVPKKDIDERVHKVARTLEIEHLLDRKPAALSGGQKQRVAIGSAIIRKPKAFLMDEPLSNLDAKLRAQMRIELAKLHKELETTIIYVTHDQTEAMTLGTRIVVMSEGIGQKDEGRVEHDSNRDDGVVEGCIGWRAMNFMQEEVEEETGESVVYNVDRNSGRKVKLKGYRAEMAKLKALNRKVTLGIRPEDIYTEEEAAEKGFEKATEGMTEIITARELLGAEVFLYFDEQGRSHTARMKPENKTRTGEAVRLYFDPERIHLFDSDTEENLFYAEEVRS